MNHKPKTCLDCRFMEKPCFCQVIGGNIPIDEPCEHFKLKDQETKEEEK